MSALARSLPYSTYGKNYLYMASRQTSLARYLESNYAPYLMRKEMLEPEWMLPADEQFALQQAFPHCLLPAGADPLSRPSSNA